MPAAPTTPVKGTTTAAKGQGTSTADHPGIYTFTTGTTAGSATEGYGYMTAANGFVLGTGALFFRSVFLAPATKPTSTAANLARIYLGMGTQPSSGTYPGADFVGFVFDPSSGMANAANNWGFLTRKASVNTFTDTGFAYSTTLYADLSLFFDSTGAYFRAYNWAGTAQAKSAAITSNTPLTTTVLCPVLHIANGVSGTTSYQCFHDLWEVAYWEIPSRPFSGGAAGLKNF